MRNSASQFQQIVVVVVVVVVVVAIVVVVVVVFFFFVCLLFSYIFSFLCFLWIQYFLPLLSLNIDLVHLILVLTCLDLFSGRVR